LKIIKAYEEFKILGCAVEGYSSSHHGGSHRTDDHVMYGQWAFLKKRKELEPFGFNSFASVGITGLEPAQSWVFAYL